MCSYRPTTGLYPESVESIPQPPFYCFDIHFKYGHTWLQHIERS